MKRATARPALNASIAAYFNPRPREEGDNLRPGAYKLSKISIHALVKRATACVKRWENFTGISIHALVKRATEGAKFALSTFAISIHALVKRATRAFVKTV